MTRPSKNWAGPDWMKSLTRHLNRRSRVLQHESGVHDGARTRARAHTHTHTHTHTRTHTQMRVHVCASVRAKFVPCALVLVPREVCLVGASSGRCIIGLMSFLGRDQCGSPRHSQVHSATCNGTSLRLPPHRISSCRPASPACCMSSCRSASPAACHFVDRHRRLYGIS